MSLAGQAPWFERSEARGEDEFHPGGLIDSGVAGRTDRIPLAVAADSHVIPADVVSGLGQGNSIAGANILNMALRMGPYGTPLTRGGGGGRGIPSPPGVFRGTFQMPYAKGGSTHPEAGAEKTPIMAAGGEFIVPKYKVVELGGGNARKGHDLLDKMIAAVRKHQMDFLKNAPPPKK